MSRIGKQTISIPPKTDVAFRDGRVHVKGPLGELSRAIKPSIAVEVSPGEVRVVPKNESIETRALWGTYAAHIANMIAGVHTAYQKTLIIEGIGYRAELSGKQLTFALGFSHPVVVSIPEGITVSVEKNVLSISGADKEAVGQFAAEIRDLKKPEPYKGKGIRYSTEVVRRKQGKKTA